MGRRGRRGTDITNRDTRKRLAGDDKIITRNILKYPNLILHGNRQTDKHEDKQTTTTKKDIYYQTQKDKERERKDRYILN